MRHLYSTTAAACLVAASQLCAGTAYAQKSFPTKPVRIISPFSAGGSTDIIARMLAQKFNEAWGQPVVVENRPGAGGNLGAEAVAKAAPDGHTLLLSASSVSINPSLYAKMPFDTAKDLAPVGLTGTVPNILVVHPSLPVQTVPQFIALAKKQPDTLSYASGGSGTGSHLIAELFQHTVGIRLVHVPYKGSGPSTLALLTGECVSAFNNMIAAIPHVQAGRMRAIAVTSAERAALLPQVPTIAESGVRGFEADSWYGVYTTGGSPQEAVSALNAELNRVLDLPDIREKFHALGITTKKLTVAQMQAFMRAEMAKWAKVVALAKAKVE